MVFIGCGEEYSRLLIKESRIDVWCPNIDQSMLGKRQFRKHGQYIQVSLERAEFELLQGNTFSNWNTAVTGALRVAEITSGGVEIGEDGEQSLEGTSPQGEWKERGKGAGAAVGGEPGGE